MSVSGLPDDGRQCRPEASDGVEVLEAESHWIHDFVAGCTIGGLTMRFEAGERGSHYGNSAATRLNSSAIDGMNFSMEPSIVLPLTPLNRLPANSLQS